jgi:hypothetical protein
VRRASDRNRTVLIQRASPHAPPWKGRHNPVGRGSMRGLPIIHANCASISAPISDISLSCDLDKAFRITAQAMMVK